VNWRLVMGREARVAVTVSVHSHVIHVPPGVVQPPHVPALGAEAEAGGPRQASLWQRDLLRRPGEAPIQEVAPRAIARRTGALIGGPRARRQVRPRVAAIARALNEEPLGFVGRIVVVISIVAELDAEGERGAFAGPQIDVGGGG